MMKLLYILIVFTGNFVLAFLLTRLISHFSNRFRVLCKDVPLIGGTSIAVTLLLDLIIFPFRFSPETSMFVFAAAIIFLMGIVDDLHELSVKAKFVFQLIAAGIVIASGVRTQIMYLGGMLNFVVTLLWIVGLTNAFNLLDIADGLAGGASLLVCLGLASVVLLNRGALFPAAALIALSGAISGFLVINFPPAKVYLGNSGSHFIGFIIAVFAIKISYATVGKGIALFTPLIILGLPLFDTMFLIFIRLSKWKLPFYKTRDHMAMRLRVLGYRPWMVLAIMLAICFLYVAGGVLISQLPNAAAMCILSVLLFFSFLLARKTLSVIIHE